MTAEEDISSDLVVLGGPIGGGAAKSGTGLVWGLYEITSTEDNDWIILSEFEEIMFASCLKIATGALTDEPITIDATDKTKLVLTGGSTDVIRIFVIGTPAVND
ncbi:MAG: hypothetical protein QQN41_00090 [Nitrosopumilus sp.]